VSAEQRAYCASHHLAIISIPFAFYFEEREISNKSRLVAGRMTEAGTYLYVWRDGDKKTMTHYLVNKIKYNFLGSVSLFFFHLVFNDWK
jgi:hypothetical protein